MTGAERLPGTTYVQAMTAPRKTLLTCGTLPRRRSTPPAFPPLSKPLGTGTSSSRAQLPARDRSNNGGPPAREQRGVHLLLYGSTNAGAISDATRRYHSAWHTAILRQDQRQLKKLLLVLCRRLARPRLSPPASSTSYSRPEGHRYLFRSRRTLVAEKRRHSIEKDESAYLGRCPVRLPRFVRLCQLHHVHQP